jgi:hypothetical protein
MQRRALSSSGKDMVNAARDVAPREGDRSGALDALAGEVCE